VSLAEIAFPACSFNHSDISPSGINTCERSTTNDRTRLLRPDACAFIPPVDSTS
jgi:hypothetical protein